MKYGRKRRWRVAFLSAGLLAAAAVWTAASSANSPPDPPASGKVYVCHATSDTTSGSGQHYNLLEIAMGAAFSNGMGGHFTENGSPQSGHEQDFVLIVSGDTTTYPPLTPKKFYVSGTGDDACTNASAVLTAQLRSLTAHASARTVNVHWRTASEINVAGYNVYGVVNGHRTRLNARIIASKGSNNRYSFTYRVPRGKKVPSRILLQVLNLDRSRQWRSASVAS